jgi:hypothetical protein
MHCTEIDHYIWWFISALAATSAAGSHRLSIKMKLFAFFLTRRKARQHGVC